MSTFKKQVGEVDLQRIVVAVQNRDVKDLVKPEFISIAVARGGAKLDELKDDVRKILEPSLVRAIENGE